MTRPPIVVSESGFLLVSPGGNEILWADVRRIRSYKIDLFSHDEICLCFEMSDGSSFEVGEGTDGFAVLKEAMEKALPAIN